MVYWHQVCGAGLESPENRIQDRGGGKRITYVLLGSPALCVSGAGIQGETKQRARARRLSDRCVCELSDRTTQQNDSTSPSAQHSRVNNMARDYLIKKREEEKKEGHTRVRPSSLSESSEIGSTLRFCI